MNIFNYIDNYIKNNTSVYGDLLNNKFNIENELSSTDKNLYKQINIMMKHVLRFKKIKI